MENLYILAELLETTSSAVDCFVRSEMALNDGDVESCQRFSKKGQILVNALIKDTFLEVQEAYGKEIEETNDYDYPNNFELIKALNQVVMYASGLLAEDIDKVKDIILTNLFKAINTAKEIYLALFEN